MREPFLCQRLKNGCDIIFDRYYYIFFSEYFAIEYQYSRKKVTSMRQHPMPADMSIKEKIWGLGNNEMDTSQLTLSGVGLLAGGVFGFGSFALIQSVILSIFLFLIIAVPPLVLAFYRLPSHPDMSLWVYLQRKRRNSKKSKRILNVRLAMANKNSLSHQQFDNGSEGLKSLVSIKKKEYINDDSNNMKGGLN